MAVVLQGLGPDSAACISRYRSLCSEQDFEAVKNFLNELIRQDQEKFLLLIITSKVARIPDKSLEYDIFEYLYGSHQLPLYLRIYANTRCCYKVSNAPDVERADRYLARGLCIAAPSAGLWFFGKFQARSPAYWLFDNVGHAACAAHPSPLE